MLLPRPVPPPVMNAIFPLKVFSGSIGVLMAGKRFALSEKSGGAVLINRVEQIMIQSKCQNIKNVKIFDISDFLNLVSIPLQEKKINSNFQLQNNIKV
ncbi:hypothetical protein BpHYR1_043339 [Brachionus plicatilis]|uniref:Uncharacterized protein n=1 Tax=Brachionus plicatilis TaxID=10195 RepID=A0A3M7QHJ6_BRAPC|nr:hypothetical protein BpHYR1_043339 [Brachionus plicatilis]